MDLILATATRFTEEWWLSVGLALGVLVIAAIVLTAVARRYVRKLVSKAEAGRQESSDKANAQRLQRTATIAHISLSTAQVLIWSAVLLIILASMGVNLGPLVVGAGIVGVALGFGAQTIVRDTLSGVFILAEDQFDLGDAVELQTTGGPVVGTVEAVTLRVTSIRSFDGTLNIVPNGNINVTSNRTRGWGRAIVDIRLSFGEDVERIRVLLLELFDELGDVEPFATGLRSTPEVLGVIQLAMDAQILRVAAETQPARRWEVERDLRERVTTRLAERGVSMAAAAVVSTPPKP